MLKKILGSLMVFLMVLFVIFPAKAELLTWEGVVDDTHGGGPGWGDETNEFVSSMTTFNGQLYAASYNDGQGVEVWKSSNGTDWTQSNQDGFGVHTTSYALLTVYGNYLYAIISYSGGNTSSWRTTDGTTWEISKQNIGADDGITISAIVCASVYNFLYIGGINGDNDSIVIGTTDGTTWHQVNVSGFGDANNTYVQSLHNFGGKLYAGVRNDTTGTEIWAYDGSTWTQNNTDGFDGTANNRAVSALVSFDGKLYAGTENAVNAPEVWRSSGDGSWEKVAENGFGQGGFTNTYSGHAFRNYIYFGTQNGKVFRSANGTSYEQVNEDGFGQVDAEYIEFADFGDYLYVGSGIMGERNTVKIYRYYSPLTVTQSLPATGPDYLNKYILDAILY